VSGEKPREIAARVLGRRGEREFTEELLDRALGDLPMQTADRRLCMELVYGVVRWQAALDWLISQKTANRTQKPALQNLLRLGLYQIFWLERVPDHAAVNVTVELAKRLGFGPQAGFVNALLRGYLRAADATRVLLADLKRTQPAIAFSHPDWLVRRWQARWGDSRTTELLAWNNTPPKTFARVNTLKADAATLLPMWREENVEYDFVRRDWFDENLVFELKSHPPLEHLVSFQKGLFYIQDPSTLLAVQQLSPRPGESVLDLCAAPGGKLTFIAQLVENKGRLIAHDTSAGRLKLVTENCARLGISCVETVATGGNSGDLLAVSSVTGISQFDKVLLDAPCSNTGVMRRRVDLRYRVTEREIERLKTVQLEVIRAAVRFLKPGGTLVYSTCSLEPEENEQVLKVLLAEDPWLKLVSQRELTPFSDEVDGAFVGALQRA
jgi:16S rRNA (cytosine967-C5)-methyltransferase